ncbi:hypothetical protein [Halomonas sp. PA16-9]|uniref:hypothetical protein n=1 Tax=Halomonas sp. PA16-9 TaxID=2576841 RepID=UPI0012DA40D8|nr:hypothetical protein FDY98_25850 [Halomonas sp. PA16-9]
MSLMGYRSTLLGSVIALTLFYGGGSVIAFYALGPDTLQAGWKHVGCGRPMKMARSRRSMRPAWQRGWCWRVQTPFGHGCWVAWYWAPPL